MLRSARSRMLRTQTILFPQFHLCRLDLVLLYLFRTTANSWGFEALRRASVRWIQGIFRLNSYRRSTQ